VRGVAEDLPALAPGVKLEQDIAQGVQIAGDGDLLNQALG